MTSKTEQLKLITYNESKIIHDSFQQLGVTT